MTRGIDRPSATSARVILIEDDADFRNGLAEFLRLKDVNVTEVASGADCYSALRGNRFDVAIVDINLPDISGFKLARTLSGERRMGVIILTARGARMDRIKGYKGGADLFLTKPVDGDELVLAVRNLARRIAESRPPAASGIRVAPSASDPWKLLLRRRCLVAPDGSVLQLSGREMIIMEHLSRKDGETAERDELISLLKYDTLGPESRSLDALLRRLRRKAEGCGLDLPLVTVRGLGVRFTSQILID